MHGAYTSRQLNVSVRGILTVILAVVNLGSGAALKSLKLPPGTNQPAEITAV